MIVKIVGFKVGQTRPTCYYEVDSHGLDVQVFDLNQKLGITLRKALEKSDFVSVRK